MKYQRQLLGMAAWLLMTSLYGCEPALKRNDKQLLVAQSTLENEKPSNNTVKIALLLDTSNSMDGLIDQAKAQLWDIVNKFAHAKCGKDQAPKLEIALYQYGNDNLSSREGYIQQVLDFSPDLDEISEKLFSLTTNGGEEFCGQVIQKSLNQLEWGRNADHLKMIFIAGNEPFTQGRLDYRDAAVQAKEKDIIVNTIFCGNYEQGIRTEWKRGAILTGGEYTAIDHNKQTVYIETPYDDIIIKLNSKLNSTYISYGTKGKQKLQIQADQDGNAMEMEEVVAVKRAVSKSSRLYKNSSWDLVDAVEEDVTALSKIDKNQLPEELKDKSPKEMEVYIQKKKAERERIQQEILELNQKRNAYIAKNQKEDSKGELENAMLKAIEKQAARKNYKW
ncbi:MAG: vWA domain-containing protein [Bacteroidota bacterium]